MPRHFLTLMDLSKDELLSLITRAGELKKLQQAGTLYRPFVGRTLAMIFEKSSTRTRVSFETGMGQFGGQALFLSPANTQLGRGESVADSAQAIGRMVDIVMMRTFAHERIETFAKHSLVPVINALTDDFHPCQLLADMQTFFEHRGDIQGKTVTWIGDGNNMCHSYMLAAHQFGFHLHIATPKGYEPRADLLAKFKDCITLIPDPMQAAKGSHLIATDVWASMGQEEEQAKRELAFQSYQVNEAILDKACKDVLFMHCLPAHRGEEISPSLLDDPRSVVWDAAENRLHSQKALIELLLKDKINV